MARPLPPGIPDSFWEEYRKRHEDEIAEHRQDLARLESGEVRLGKREGGGPWVDVTQEWIAHHKAVIAQYETILAALKRGELI